MSRNITVGILVVGSTLIIIGGVLAVRSNGLKNKTEYAFPVDRSITSLTISIQPIEESARQAVGYTPDPVYEQLARETGGQVVPLSSEMIGSDHEAVDRIMERTITDGGAAILYAEHAGGGALPAPVLMTPTGALIQGNATTTSTLEITTVGGSVWFTIKNPEVGVWHVLTNRNSSHAIQVRGDSSVTVYRFQKVSIQGRVGHTGYFPDVTPFAAKEDAMVETVLFGLDATSTRAVTPAIELVSATLDTLAAVQTMGRELDHWYGVTNIPAQPFRVRVRFTDAEGQMYQRMLPELYTPI